MTSRALSALDLSLPHLAVSAPFGGAECAASGPAVAVSPLSTSGEGKGARSAPGVRSAKRIGGEVPLTASAAPAPAPSSEVGFSGTNISSGYVRDDYNPEMHWPTSIRIYDKMRRDSQVQAIEMVINLPIRTVRFYVQPAGDSPADVEAAELVERNLLCGEWMSLTWDDLVRQALISTMVGYSVFETIVAEQDGYLVFSNFAPRHPRTVGQWTTDANGAVTGITQTGLVNSQTRTVDIPGDKLLRFTYREEFGNPEGFALCRTLYKNWYFKEALYRIAGIGAERDWVGTPLGKAPAGASDKDREDFLAAIQKLCTHEEAGVVLPSGFELDTYHGGTKTDAIMSMIDHHDMSMARAALASFLNIVGQARGSSALSVDQSQFFLLALQALATWLVGVINQGAVRKLCDWNFPGIRQYPTIEHASMGTILQPVAVAHALAALVNKSILTPDMSVEEAVRQMMSLPEIPEDQRALYDQIRQAPTNAPGAQPPAPPAAPSADPDPSAPAAASLATQAHVARPGAPCACHADVPFGGAECEVPAGHPIGPAVVVPPSPSHGEGSGVRSPGRPSFNLDRVRREIMTAEDTFVRDGRAILDRMIAGFQKSAGAIVDAAIKAPDLERGKAHLALADLNMPLRSRYQAWIRDFLMSVVVSGAAAAADETGIEMPAIPNELRSFVTAQASTLTEKHLADLKFVAVAQAQRDLDARLGRDQLMVNVRSRMIQQADANLQASLADACRAVTDQLSAALQASAIRPQSP